MRGREVITRPVVQTALMVLESNGSSQSSGCATRRNFPAVEWRTIRCALWQASSTCSPKHCVAGAHGVSALGRQAPGVRDGQLARPRGPAPGGGYGVALAKGCEARRAIKGGNVGCARHVGDGSGLERDRDRQSDGSCKRRRRRCLRIFSEGLRHRTERPGVRVEVSQDARFGRAIRNLSPNCRRSYEAAHTN